MPATHCPACGMRLDAASAVIGDAKPRAGDLSICVYCATMLLWETPTTLVLLPDKVWDEVPPEDKVAITKVLRKVEQHIRDREEDEWPE